MSDFQKLRRQTFEHTMRSSDPPSPNDEEVVLPPEPWPLPGERYSLGVEIASGGMGTIVHAVDRLLERPVALKLLHPALAPSRRRDGASSKKLGRRRSSITRASCRCTTSESWPMGGCTSP